MEITGKVIKILDAQKYTSKRDGSEVVKNFFVIETSGQYPKKICFSVIGAEKFGQMGVRVGVSYSVSFDIESREWNGKWFTDVSAWRVVPMDGQQATQPTPAPVAAAPVQETEKKDDLPF